MERKITLEIRQLQQSLKHKVEKDRVEDAIALTHGQVRVLMFIHQSEKVIYQKDIEDYLHIRRSTATEMLNILERNHYLHRERASHDGRLKEIKLSPKTLAVIDEMAIRMRDVEILLRKGVDEKDLEVFFYVLDQMNKNLR